MDTTGYICTMSDLSGRWFRHYLYRVLVLAKFFIGDTDGINEDLIALGRSDVLFCHTPLQPVSSEDWDVRST